MAIKQFLILIIVCFSNIGAIEETFQTRASDSRTYIIPIFSSESTFVNFKKSLNFILSLPDRSPDLYIYSSSQYYECNCETNWDKNGTFLNEIYNFSKTRRYFHDFLTIALLQVQQSRCKLFEECKLKRYNVIILTDYYNITKYFEIKRETLQQLYYYVLFSRHEKTVKDYLVIHNSSNPYNPYKFYDVDKVIPSLEISQEIFDEFMYFFEFPFFSYYLQTYGNDYRTGWDTFYPTFYVASLRKNETFFYESIAVLFVKSDLLSALISLRRCVYSTTSTRSSSLAERFLKNTFETELNNTVPNVSNQWNVIITDTFPLWLQNLNLSLGSPHKHLDIYLYAYNNTYAYKNLKNSTRHHLNDIFPNDENATKRMDHIMLTFDMEEFISQKTYWPTGRYTMPAHHFDYKSPNRWWIWAIPTFVVSIIAIIALITFLRWRRRMKLLLEEKYEWAIKAGFTIKEADVMIENGKELFIDEKLIKVDYENQIGKGSSAIIYKGHLNPGTTSETSLRKGTATNYEVAIKILDKFGKTDYQQLFREVDAAKKLGWHPHICYLLGWSIRNLTPRLIYEVIDGSNLHTWITSTPSKDITEKEVAKILWQISDGMEYIITVGIIHRDLAARNILLSITFHVKITDFGLACCCSNLDDHIYQSKCQQRLPIRWMAPETLTNRIFSEASDCWSFGILAWELFSKGEVPYGILDGNEILQFILTGKRLEIPNNVSDIFKELLKNCWKFNRKERPNFKAIKYDLDSYLEKSTQDYGYLLPVKK